MLHTDTLRESTRSLVRRHRDFPDLTASNSYDTETHRNNHRGHKEFFGYSVFLKCRIHDVAKIPQKLPELPKKSRVGFSVGRERVTEPPPGTPRTPRAFEVHPHDPAAAPTRFSPGPTASNGRVRPYTYTARPSTRACLLDRLERHRRRGRGVAARFLEAPPGPHLILTPRPDCSGATVTPRRRAHSPMRRNEVSSSRGGHGGVWGSSYSSTGKGQSQLGLDTG